MIFADVVMGIITDLVSDQFKEVSEQVTDHYPKVIDNIILTILKRHPDLTITQIDVLFSEETVDQAIKRYLKNPDKLDLQKILTDKSSDLFDENFSKDKAISIICDVFEILDEEIENDPVLRENLDHTLINKMYRECVEKEPTITKILSKAEEELNKFAYEKAEKLSLEAYKLNNNNEQAVVVYGRSILSKICNCFESRKLNVLVIGDIMLDHTLRGGKAKDEFVGYHNTIDKAYMLYTKDSESYTLGGVGYLGRAFSVIVKKVSMVVAVGNDCEGNIIRNICKGRLDYNGKVLKQHEERDIELLDVCDNDIITTTKIYFIKGAMKSKKEKTIRFDREERYLPSSAMEERDEDYEEEPGKTIRLKIFDKFISCVNNNPSIDCVVIDDYEKGVITKNLMKKIAKKCDEKEIGIYVDPKYNWNRFKGLNIKAMIPNIKECDRGVHSLQPTPESLNDYFIEELIIKKDKSGAAFSHDKKLYHDVEPLKKIPCNTDVGCGTVFDAYFITSRLYGYSLEESVLLANCAAGVMVTKQLGEVVTPQEIIDKIATENMYFVDNKNLIKILMEKL